MKNLINSTAIALTATLLFAPIHAAQAGNILKDIGNGLKKVEKTVKKAGRDIDKGVLKPVYETQKKVVNSGLRSGERVAKDVGETIGKTGKLALSATGLKLLEDTLIEGKPLDTSAKESLRDIKNGVKSIAKAPMIANHVGHAITESTTAILGKEAGRVVGIVQLPRQVASGLGGAIAEATLSATERDDNIEHVVGVPLATALEHAHQFYKDKAKPLPTAISNLLSVHFDKEHLKTVRYVVDDTGGNIAGLINGIKQQMGDKHGHNHAVAIGNIVIFAKEPGGKENLFFWAHEVHHTVQYKNMGIVGFATRVHPKFQSD